MKNIIAIKNKVRILLAASLLVLGVVSLPIWLPGLMSLTQAQAAANPNSEASLILLDGGWFDGQTEFRMVAVPQIVGWNPGNAQATWATETGFLYGGVFSSDRARLYVLEHRKIGVSSLRGLTFTEHDLYRNSKEWGIFLTKIDPNTGRVINRAQLPEPPIKNYSDVTLVPLSVQGDTLYLFNYAVKNNLFAYDMKGGAFSAEAFSTCEKGYLMKAVFIEASNSVASLCTDFQEKPVSWVTLVSLTNGTSRSLEVPVMGKQDYETGNGLFLGHNGELYVIDTDAGVLAELNMQTMQLSKKVDYLASLPTQESSLQDRFVDWLTGLGSQTAYAKRWMGLSSISPDGRWLAVDAGLGYMAEQTTKPGLVIIDLETLEATQLVAVTSVPSGLAFTDDGSLLVFYEKNSSKAPLRGTMINLASGEQGAFTLTLNGWLHSILSP